MIRSSSSVPGIYVTNSHQVSFNRLLNKCSRLHDGCQDSAALLVRVYALVHKLAASTTATEFRTPRRAREIRARGLHGIMRVTCVRATSGPQTLHAVEENRSKRGENRVQVQQLTTVMCIDGSHSLRMARLASHVSIAISLPSGHVPVPADMILSCCGSQRWI